ncbi:MAG: FlgD immunoglobulin-like domain containing protein, partial [Candidatus Eiseniibacteriota bacterium]
VPGISSLGFHDADADPSNDWPVSLVGDVLTWATTEYPDPDAAPLEFGSMINFRFTADAEPVRGDATLGIHEPGVAESIVASTSLPSGTSAGIADPADSPPVTARLLPVRPNPLDLPGTTLPFELAAPTVVELAIYDAGGRHVRTLIEGPLDGGRHTVTWDGRDGRDRRVGSGVYYARLRAGDRVAVRSMVVID